MAVDLKAAVGRSDRCFQLGMIVGKIIERQQAADLLREAHNRTGDIAPIKGVPSSLDPRRSSLATRFLLGPHHGFQDIRQVSLDETLTWLGCPTIRTKICRALREILKLPGDLRRLEQETHIAIHR